jgi:hypothetical protein
VVRSEKAVYSALSIPSRAERWVRTCQEKPGLLGQTYDMGCNLTLSPLRLLNDVERGMRMAVLAVVRNAEDLRH